MPKQVDGVNANYLLALVTGFLSLPWVFSLKGKAVPWLNWSETTKLSETCTLHCSKCVFYMDPNKSISLIVLCKFDLPKLQSFPQQLEACWHMSLITENNQGHFLRLLCSSPLPCGLCVVTFSKCVKPCSHCGNFSSLCTADGTSFSDIFLP